MTKRIATDMGEYIIYHVSEAGSPDAHNTASGEWFYQPADDTSGDVFSEGYPSEDAAESAALDWVASEQDEAN